MIAVSTYIRKLRDASGLSQEEAAVRADISSKTLGRWEKGVSEHEPGISNLKRLVLALGGSTKDALQLLIHDQADEEDGATAAEMWLELSEEERQRVDSVLDSAILPDDLIEVIAELRADYQDDRTLAALLRGVLLSGRVRGSQRQ
jgi:transcriptional regulator with XRE-family HTH domain